MDRSIGLGSRGPNGQRKSRGEYFGNQNVLARHYG